MTRRKKAVAGLAFATLAVTLGATAAPAGPPARAQDSSLASCPWLNQRLPISQRVSMLVSKMTLAQKVSLMQLEPGGSSGPYAGFQVYSPAIPSLCVPAMTQHDDSAGVASGATGVTQLPAPISAASTFDPAVLRQYGSVIGAEMRGQGNDDALAPTINLDRVPQWGRNFETLGEDPYLTAQLGDADIEGIQSQGVIADVKHYAMYNQETGRNPSAPADDDIVSSRTMQETELYDFGSVIQDATASAGMCAFPLINGTFNCQDAYLLTQVLRDQFGFKGDIRSDYQDPITSDVAAANAGLDQTRAPFFDAANLEADVANGSISMTTINKAAAEIVYPMFQMGIINNPPTGKPGDNVSTPAHVAFAQQTAEQGTVLLRNSGGALPLNVGKVSSIAVIGGDADTYADTSGGGSAHVLASNIVTPLQGITARAGKNVTVTYSQGSGPWDALPDIPSAQLTPASGSGNGLTAQIYPNATLSGTPAVTGTDPTVDRDSATSPLPGPQPSQTWSESWTGTLTPSVTGDTPFTLTCNDPCQLSLNGQTVIDNSGAAQYMTHHQATGSTDLTAGKPVSVDVTYIHNGGKPTAIAQLGWEPPGTTPASVTEAAQAAANAQVAIVFAGTFESEGFDQPNLSLSGVGDQLIEAIAKANPDTIVVLNTGGPVLMPWLDQVKGVLEAWYPGQQDGTSIASVLFGDTDPGGKLPDTFPATESQPLSADPARWPGIDGKVEYSEGLDIGYKWYDAEGLTPLFPFGYGLSYTSFAFSGLHITPMSLHGLNPNREPNTVVAVVSARVTNTGHRAGSEVAQLYLTDPAAAGEPVRQLRGFQRVTLAPGASAEVSMPLTAQDLAYWNTPTSDWAVAPGTYSVHIGDSSALVDLPLSGTFQAP